MKYEEPTLKIIFLEKSVVVTLTSGDGSGDISTWPPKKTLEIDEI